MVITRVSDSNDDRLDAFRWRERQLASRAQRNERVGAGMFVAEGDLVVERAIAAGREPVALLCGDELAERMSELVDAATQIYVGDDTLRRDVTGLGVPLSVVGLFARPPLVDPLALVARSRHLVILEAVDNPTNVGAIVRSAAALGWNGLLLDATSADPLARRALRVSMGSGLVMPFARIAPDQHLGEILAAMPHTVFALTPSDDAQNISSIDVPRVDVAIALGAERVGLSDTVMSRAHTRVRIPMHAGTDSLNVGAAAAIALHALGPNAHSST